MYSQMKFITNAQNTVITIKYFGHACIENGNGSYCTEYRVSLGLHQYNEGDGHWS